MIRKAYFKFMPMDLMSKTLVIRCIILALSLLAYTCSSFAENFTDGWKWYQHRKSQNASTDELKDILKTLKSKYVNSGIDMTDVNNELTLYNEGATDADETAGYEDGWRWYLHRKKAKAAQKELVDILETLINKYTGTEIDLTEAKQELSRYKKEPAIDQRHEGAVSPRLQGNVPGISPVLPAPPILQTTQSPVIQKTVPESAVKSLPTQKHSPLTKSNPANEAKLIKNIEKIKNPDAEIRLEAIEQLKEIQDTRAVSAIVDHLGDSDRFVAIVAANALAYMGDIALEPLLKSAANENADVRIVACLALGNLGNPSALPVLEKCEKDISGEVRSASETAIKKIKANQKPYP